MSRLSTCPNKNTINCNKDGISEENDLLLNQFWDISQKSNVTKLNVNQFNKKVRKEIRRRRWDDYRTQGGIPEAVETAKEYISKLQAVKSIPIPVDVFYHIEGAIALYFALSRADSTVQISAIIYLYCSRYYGKSVTSLVSELISDILTEHEPVNQAGEEGNSFISSLSYAKDNWQMFINSTGVINVSKVISILLSLGLCDSSSINFSIAGVRLFAFNAMKKQVGAVDLIDAVFSTICYFVEGGYECFKTGSILPLMGGDLNLAKLENDMLECERLADYAKAGNLNKFADMDENDLDSFLSDTLKRVDVAIKTSTNDFIKRMLKDKFDKLKRIQTGFIQTRVQGGLREAPYGFCIYGSSGVGKSGVSTLILICVLAHNGFNAKDDHLTIINDKDKFMSNYKSDTNGIFLDDIGNTKSDFVETSPCSRIIEIINNVRSYANVAEADMKGKVAIEPKVVSMTTNVKDMCATMYSNEPASVVRRAQFVATVNVKPQFTTGNSDMLDSQKVYEYYDGNVPFIPDLWDITVEKAFPIKNPTPGQPDTIGYERVMPMIDGEYNYGEMNIKQLITFACQTSKVYFKNQKHFVENSNNLAEKLDFCDKCGFPASMCKCCKKDDGLEDEEETDDEDDIKDTVFDCETQSGYVMFKTYQYINNNYIRRTKNKFDSMLDYVEEKSCDLLLDRLKWLETSPYTCWTNYIPSQHMRNKYIQNLIFLYSREELKENIKYLYFNAFLMILGILFLTYFISHWFFGLLCLPAYVIINVVEREKDRLYARVAMDNQSMPKIFKEYRDSYITYICGFSLSIAIVYLLVKSWKFVKWSTHEQQGNLTPTCMQDILERDKEAEIEKEISVEHNWSTVKVHPIPCTTIAHTTTNEQLRALILKNSAFIYTFNDNNKMCACNIFFVKSNIALIPNHFMLKDNMETTVCHKTRSSPGTSFKAIISKSYSVNIPNTDLTLVYVPNGGCWRDMTEYFPTDYIRDCVCHLSYKKLVGDTIEHIECDMPIKNGLVGNTAKQFMGASYELTFDTFVGLCMAVLSTNCKQSVIAGFHLGGISGQKHGISGSLLRCQLLEAIECLSKKDGLVISASTGNFRTKIYDKQILLSDEVHYKSPLHQLSPDSNIQIFGTCPGRAKYFSDVEDSCISELVEEVCDVKNNFGKPKFHLGKAWANSIQHSSNPSIGFEGDLLERAVIDYKETIFEQFLKIPALASNVRPLTEMETVCGIDGVRFIDRMPMNTSVGAPLSGAKSNYITELDPKDYPCFACPASLDQKFWDEFHYCKKEFLAGRRVYFTFKACLKDEPTKIDKEKVRVFQAAPIVLQLFTRMYFLPIARLFSIFPLTTECAVGINTVGPEFHDLIMHMMKYGEDRILAGDYSKYDLRMPAMLIMAAFDIMISVAEKFNYSKGDITIMRCIATEIANPVMFYNGDLVLHHGSNPSGQNLTVYINSIVNSLMMRSCYFKIYPKGERFDKAAAMMTYGDDVKGSVSKKYDNFNFISYAEFLKDHDMVFTLPSKDQDIIPEKYMKEQDADFLKRKSVWNPYIKLWQGALDENSIFKSLMSNLKSKALTKEELAVGNIDGAMREWFLHGKETFEKRQRQMREVASRKNLVGCCMLSKTYNTTLQEYCQRYNLPTPDSECL